MAKKIRKKKIIRLFWGIVCFPFALLFLLILLILLGVFGFMPTFEDLENPKSKLATEVISSDNVVLGTFHIENRSFTSYDELSPNLVHALVATEDARFYSHPGIDMRSLARVAVKTVGKGDKRSGGGSTISQQLALNLYSERESNLIKRSIQKLKEWITAVQLERNYTKEEIIAMYFNTVPFGSNAFGIRSASQTFFAKSPSELTVEEAALLVGLVNGPTWYSPVRNPERSQERRNWVISQMCKYGYLTVAEKDSIQAIPLNMSSYAMQDHNTGLAPHFREMIRQTMYAKKPERKRFATEYDYRVDSLRWVADPLYGWCSKNVKIDGTPYNIERDGLRIYTTINSKVQLYAEQAMAEHLGKELQLDFDKELKGKKRAPYANNVSEAREKQLIESAVKQSDRYRLMAKAGVSDKEIRKSFNEPTEMTIFSWHTKGGSLDTVMKPIDSIRYYKSLLRSGFMAMDPQTGNVLAYVGSPTFRYMKFDHVKQGKRQIGSTVKPFLYTIAMQEGLNPCYEVLNVPTKIPLPDGSVWEPKNSGKAEDIGRTVTLKWALAMSNNWISAWLIDRFGPEALADMCHKMGIKSFIDPVVASCLGPADCSVFEMVGAYATFANKGVHTEPFYVTRIEDNKGNVLANFIPERSEAISEQTAYLMLNLMQGVVNSGTAGRIRKYVPELPIAGKTGTSNDQSDGWFMGVTPRIAAGAWVGGEDMDIHFEGLAKGGGSNMALPIWALFMQKLLQDKSLGYTVKDSFTIPPGMGGFNLNCTAEITEPNEDGENPFD